MNLGEKPLYSKIAEVELIYKTKVKASERPTVRTTQDAYHIFRSIWDANRIELLEEFKVLFLNRGNKVLGCLPVSSGGITGTVADPRLILAAVIKSAACSIILCHNHPSGSLRPSYSDEDITKRIKQACHLIDVTVLDHLIITKESYFSFADEGLL